MTDREQHNQTTRMSARPMFVRRSLTLKLTLAFLVVGLLGALLVAFFVGHRAQQAFDRFVVDRNQPLIADLKRYYQMNGRWDGVAGMLERRHFGRPDADDVGLPLVLIAPDGSVVLGNERYPAHSHMRPFSRSRGVPIQLQGEVIGWLMTDSGGPRPGPGTPEAAFLARLGQAITYGAIGATTIALLLGIVLARTLTQPLRELTAATQAVAKGGLGRQVLVRSRDELGALAIAFNQMSADLARASTMRRQMTADIAHDLRTPLSVILGYTEALREGKLTGSEEIFEAIHIEAQHLQRLIDDLRTLSLADAGELPLTRQPIMPQALLERVGAVYRAQAQTQQIQLDLQTAPDLPTINVDPERMAQVLRNLLSNALRYTPAGGQIMLSAISCADSVQLQVSDTGAGIAPEALPHIFERFYRADPSRQQDGSSGLGLAIAKSIVEAHAGSLTVESTLGCGTIFTITLPAATPVLQAITV